MSPAASDQEEQLRKALQAWVRALGTLDYYALLGLERSASGADIKLAFHRFALAFHPDRYREFPPQLGQLAQVVFMRGVEAYKVLRDPRTRSDYEIKRASGNLRATQDPTTRQPLPRMSQGPAGGAQPQSLVDLCRSPAARLCAQNADREISEGNLQGARKLLLEAISKDGGNPQLQARLDALDFALDAMGG
jgi:curved DNA-binding protein CbpA